MKRLLALLALAPLHACRTTPPPENPPAPGFDLVNSDPRAVAIADEVLRASGGRAAWDATRVVKWTFFGRRTLTWDKWTGDLRLDEDGRVVLMNLNNGQGRVFRAGNEERDADTRRKELSRAASIWINDSYWLFLPFKLKDSGVTLQWKGEAKLPRDRAADVLELTFSGVGDTPQNRYEVLVARDTHDIEAWRYFERASDTTAKIETPWTDYATYGALRLSSGRGENRAITNIAVFDAPPESLTKP